MRVWIKQLKVQIFSFFIRILRQWNPPDFCIVLSGLEVTLIVIRQHYYTLFIIIILNKENFH